jgi:hypothetical protein
LGVQIAHDIVGVPRPRLIHIERFVGSIQADGIDDWPAIRAVERKIIVRNVDIAWVVDVNE